MSFRPRALFKYCTIDRGYFSRGDVHPEPSRAPFTRDGDMIKRSRLWAGSPAAFNDPFDCQPYLDHATELPARAEFIRRHFMEGHPHATEAEIERAVQAGLLKVENGIDPAHLAQAWALAMAETGVVSLTSRYDNMTMWSFYADDHKGYCLEFDKTKAPFSEAIEVRYDDVRPTYRALSADSGHQIIDALRRKARCWKTEEEWRIVRIGERGSLTYDSAALKSVILGARITQADEEALRNMVADLGSNTAIKRAVLDYRTYQMVIGEPAVPTGRGG